VTTLEIESSELILLHPDLENLVFEKKTEKIFIRTQISNAYFLLQQFDVKILGFEDFVP
jgi:hypothetical protein